MLSIAPSARVQSLPGRALRLACASSLGLHLSALAILVWLAARGAGAPVVAVDAMESHAPTPPVATPIVFVARESPKAPGGGGGGGNRQTAPIRRGESAGADAMTLRIAKPIATSGGFVDPGSVLPGIVLDAKPLASGEQEIMGLPSGGVSIGTSQGPGSGGGVGSGTGTGIGPGRGPGLGDGVGGGTGGGVYRVGGGVSAPRLLDQVQPKYTADALRQRIQGSVTLELIVSAEGAPTDIHVVRSLDPHGLDLEAIAAVRQWRFAPGRLDNVPVAVLVRVIVDFTIR